MKTICVRHSGKTRFDPPPNGCWPVRLWWWCGKCNNGMEGSRVEGRIINISDDCVASKDNIDDGAEL